MSLYVLPSATANIPLGAFSSDSDASEAVRVLPKPSFDEFLILRFRASNQAPHAFEWLDLEATNLDYGAILTRISREYNRRFRNGNGELG